MCGTQRTTLGVVPQVLSTLVFETGLLTGLELSKKARLAAHKLQHPPVSASSALGCQMPATTFSFLTDGGHQTQAPLLV